MLDFQVTADPDDRFWKVRLLFTHLNKTAKQYVKIPLKSSIDEGMIKYFGPHPLKQFIRGKPCRFGFKVCFSFFHLLFKVADPDPYQNDTDPQDWYRYQVKIQTCLFL